MGKPSDDLCIIGERRDRPVASAFVRAASAGVIHEHLAHCARCDGHEVQAVGGLDAVTGGELDVDLVYEARRLERRLDALASKLAPRDTSQLVVQQWHEGIERAALAGAHCT
jgi:hypothetical protein